MEHHFVNNVTLDTHCYLCNSASIMAEMVCSYGTEARVQISDALFHFSYPIMRENEWSRRGD